MDEINEKAKNDISELFDEIFVNDLKNTIKQHTEASGSSLNSLSKDIERSSYSIDDLTKKIDEIKDETLESIEDNSKKINSKISVIYSGLDKASNEHNEENKNHFDNIQQMLENNFLYVSNFLEDNKKINADYHNESYDNFKKIQVSLDNSFSDVLNNFKTSNKTSSDYHNEINKKINNVEQQMNSGIIDISNILDIVNHSLVDCNKTNQNYHSELNKQLTDIQSALDNKLSRVSDKLNNVSRDLTADIDKIYSCNDSMQTKLDKLTDLVAKLHSYSELSDKKYFCFVKAAIILSSANLMGIIAIILMSLF